MPRYRFHLYDGMEMHDEDGTDLPAFEHVRREAMRLASELLNTDAAKTTLGDHWRVEVADEVGTVVFRLSISMTDMDVPGVGT